MKSDSRRAEADGAEPLRHFLSAIRHDFGAPTRQIACLAEMIADQYSDVLDETGRSWLETLRLESRRLGGMLASLTTYAEIQSDSSPTEEVDLADVVNTVWHSLATKPPDAVLRVNDAPFTARGVPTHIRTLIHELLTNAVKFRSEEPLCVEVTGTHTEGSVTTTVADNGIGIPKGREEDVFEMFRRCTTLERPGLGAGLALCRLIVSRHGGTIGATRLRPHGTSILFALPASTASPSLPR